MTAQQRTETESDLAAALLETLRELLPSDTAVQVIEDEDAPMRWSVWVDEEVIGVGESRSDALEEAVETARRWSL